jgi:hypothetical protein
MQRWRNEWSDLSQQEITWMILPGMGDITVPATLAAAPRRDHLRGTAFLNSWQLPSSHMLITCDICITFAGYSLNSWQLPLSHMLITCDMFVLGVT